MSKTFQCLPGLKKSLSAGYSAMLTEIRESIDGMEDMYDLIERAIEDDPPVALREGGIIRKGYMKNWMICAASIPPAGISSPRLKPKRRKKPA